MILKHYFDFGDESNAAMQSKSDKNQTGVDWDYIRQDGKNPSFSLENSREDYIANCEKSVKARENATYIAKQLKQGEAVCSLGAGKGILEWQLKTMRPDLKLCCSDYAQDALDRLRELFIECDEFKQFDMLRGNYAELKSYDALIMYRISTEFNEAEWRTIFRNCHAMVIPKILFVPAEVADIRDLLREIMLRLRFCMKKTKPTFAGWMYSKGVLADILSEYYLISDVKKCGHTAIFTLEWKR